MQILLSRDIAPTFRDYFSKRALGDDRVHLLGSSIGNFKSTEAFSELLGDRELFGGEPLTIVQPLIGDGTQSVNDLAMQLLLTVRTAKRYGAGPIWVEMPSIAFDRQDRSLDGRMTSIGIDDLAGMLKEAGVVGVSTMEIHSEAALGYLHEHFGKENVFNLDPTDIFQADIQARKDIDVSNSVVGGPDKGANARRDAMAVALGVSKFGVEKEHEGVNTTRVTDFKGDVSGKQSITVDDMVDTGGTATNSQKELADQGALSRHFYTARPILSGDALENMFTAKASDGSHAVTDMTFTDVIHIGGKLSALEAQYGHDAVHERVRIVPAGETFFDHLVDDIASHPDMEVT